MIGVAIAHTATRPASRPALGVQPEQQRDDWRSYIKFCVLENVSVTLSNPLKKPLIKNFNRRLNHIIQSVCFSFQIHSSIAIRPMGPGRAVLHSQPHTYSHTQPHLHWIHFCSSFISFWFFYYLYYFIHSFVLSCVSSFSFSLFAPVHIPSVGTDGVSGGEHMYRIIRSL